ncbi:hypothetical protein [Hyalangium minutum]|uniref:Uncharacterized protein n=1 Tax=Hyalangium minutum TaxID=394096 RepID=A0A085WVZ4_9BACT|nr:hypothetical protein [Hyalangium minutum]KFE71857.1 hypothetical protein DB31_0118 [Hyalangium minutum]
MSKPNAKTLFLAVKEYLKEHPEEVPRAIRGMMKLRLGIPLAVPRYLARTFVSGQGHKKDVIISPAPPGLKLTTTLDALGSSLLRASLVVALDDLRINKDEVRLEFRVSEMKAEILDEGDGTSPVIAKIKSGELDFTKPANLLVHLPERPPTLVEAQDDRVCFDLLKSPDFANNPGIRRFLATINPVVGLRAVRTDDDHLDIYFRASPTGLPAAIASLFR